MAAEVKKEIALEIAHVLFIDIVAYSKMASDDQRAAIEELNQTVQSTDEFRKEESENRLLKLATGDGMALIFYHSPEVLENGNAVLTFVLPIVQKGSRSSANSDLSSKEALRFINQGSRNTEVTGVSAGVSKVRTDPK